MSQVNGNFDVKSAGFNDVASYSKKEEVDDPLKKKLENQSIFTIPNPIPNPNSVAYNNGIGTGQDGGGFNA